MSVESDASHILKQNLAGSYNLRISNDHFNNAIRRAPEIAEVKSHLRVRKAALSSKRLRKYPKFKSWNVAMQEIRRSPVEVGSLSRYLQCFLHPSWCRIFSINSIPPVGSLTALASSSALLALRMISRLLFFGWGDFSEFFSVQDSAAKKIRNLGITFTLPETNSSPLKIGFPKRKVVFQPSIFRGELLV